MRAQTRIFSVATTIACFALTSPGFAQVYVGSSGQPAVQVDLGALDTLPGPAQKKTAPAHRRGKKNNIDANADTGDYETTVVGGGGDALAPVTILYTGHHGKSAPRKAKPAPSADALNAMQLSSQKPILPTAMPSATHTGALVSMPPAAMPLDNVPSPSSGTEIPAQPSDRPPVPPALPEEERVAGLPPTRDDYDERRRHQPTYPAEPVLPPAGPVPEGTNGPQKTTFVIPKLPPNTLVTTEALNRAELNQILADKGEEPLPPLAPVIVESKPVKKRRFVKRARPSPNKAEAAPSQKVIRKAPPSLKTSQVKQSPPAAQAVTAESLNRQELAKLSSSSDQAIPKPVTEAPPVPHVEKTEVVPPPTIKPTPAAVAPKAVLPQPSTESFNRQEFAKLPPANDQANPAPIAERPLAPPSVEQTKAAPPLPAIANRPAAPAPMQPKARIAIPSVTAESLNRQELLKLPPANSQTNPVPVAEARPTLTSIEQQTKVAPPPPAATIPPAPAPIRTASIAPVQPAPSTPVKAAPDVVLPAPTKAPASTAEDLIDEGPEPNPPHTRIITDPNNNAQKAPANFSVGYYDIPSDIPLSGSKPSVPIVPVQKPVPAFSAPSPTAPAPIPSVAPSAAQTALVMQSSAATPLDQTPIAATPLPQPGSPPKNVPAHVAPPPGKPAKAVAETAPPAQPSPEALPLDQPVSLMPSPAATPAPVQKPAAVAKQPLSKAQDTTQNLNQTELSKSVTAMPLDQPPTPMTNPAPAGVKAATLPPPESKQSPAAMASAPVSPSATKLSPNDDLAVVFAPGSTALSQETLTRLDTLAGHLKQNPDLRVELRSQATVNKGSTSSMARRTSLGRALAIKSYLVTQSIAEDHIDVRALGAPPGQAPSDRVDFFLMR